MRRPKPYTIAPLVQCSYGILSTCRHLAKTFWVLFLLFSNILLGQDTAGTDAPIVSTFASACPAIWEENFDYGCNSTNAFHNANAYWTRFSGNSNDFRYQSATGLSYAGYASSGIGGAAVFRAGSNDDVNREISPMPSTGSVYASFLINMTNTNAAENFIAFRDNSATPVLYGKVFMQKVGTQYQLGIAKTGNTAAVWSTTMLNFGTTYLIVIKNEFVTGAANDIFKLWIVSSGVPASEAAAGTPIQATGQTDPQNGIRYFALRQTGNEAGLVDGIRVATTWGNAVCAGTPTPTGYATPTSTTSNTYYINEARFQGINTVQKLASSFSTSPPGYQDWTSHPKTIQAQGEPINISLSANVQVRWRAWIDWNKDGVFDTSTEQVYSNGTFIGQYAEFGFVVPVGTTPGDYRIRFRASSGTPGPCENIANGEAEDYLFTVISSCSAIITAIANGETCGPGTVNLTVTATGSPSEYRWYANETGGSPLATTTVPSWTTPSISATTTYYVTAFNGCESISRTPITATVSPVATLAFSNPSPVICGETAITELAVSGDKQLVVVFEEKFNNGLGLFENINTDANNATVDNRTAWSNKVSTHLPPSGNLWTPAISSGLSGNRFALATSDISPLAPNNIENSLTLSTGVSTAGFLNLTLSMRVFYSRYLNDGNSHLGGNYYQDDLKIEAYDGNTWNTLATYDYDLGIGNKFATLTFNLPPSYIGLADFRIRIRHFSSSSTSLYFPGGVAVDDIRLYGEKALNTAFEWTTSPTIDAYIDVACTIPYNPATDLATTVYLKGTQAQLFNPSFVITAKAQLSNGCIATDHVTLHNDNKFWQGSSSDNWSDPNNWLPAGTPTSAQCIIIDDQDPVIIKDAFNGFGRNITIKPTGSLTIASNASLTITDEVVVADNGTPTNLADDGKLIILDSGSLIQVTEVENATANNNKGSIRMQRYTKPMFRYDYTYWSSPVMADASKFLLGKNPSALSIPGLSPATLFDKYFDWTHSTPAAQGWRQINYGNEPMVEGRGYIVRAPQNYPVEASNSTPANAIPYEATFIGVPNNGIVRHPVAGGSGKWNLIGNPYPSAIEADRFIDYNTNDATSNTLQGTLYFWTHNTSIQETEISGIYYYYAGDYASYNKSGGVGTAPSVMDGSGDTVINTTNPTGKIAAGQAFFVEGTSDGQAIFNNSMRTASGNNGFFRPSQPEPINDWETKGRHRVWLNLKGATKGFSQTLVGYIEGATDGPDRLFDGKSFGGNHVTFYSVLENQDLVIQGRALPFSDQDQVALGYKSTLNGTFTISIDRYDGLFEGQDIYLEDKLLNNIHDLKTGPYSFTSTIGTFNERFVLRYVPSAELSNPDFGNIASGLIVYQENGRIILKSQLEDMRQITVYDLLGRIVFDQDSIWKREFFIQDVVVNKQPLIVKVVLANGQVDNKKIVY